MCTKFIDLLTLKLHEYQFFLQKMLLSYTLKNRIFWIFHISGFWGNHKRRTLIFFHLWFLSCITNPWVQITVLLKYSCSSWLGDVLIQNSDSSPSHEKPGFRVSSLYSASLLKEEYSPGCKFHLILPSLRLHLTSCTGCRESQLTQVPFCSVTE